MGEWTGGNLLCYGDNLTYLQDRALFADECVDLIYLDPPFNSQQSYNVLFKESSGAPETAQIKAFEDTWKWDQAANKALSQLHTDPAVPAALADLAKTFMSLLRASPMMAYLVQMAIRLVHMHRVLKPTGSLYLHCDPTASHYLKLILDAIFGPQRFRNEIVWERTTGRKGGRQFGRVHDIILLYSRSDQWTWNPPTISQDAETARGHDILSDEEGRRYRLSDLTGAGQGPARSFGGQEIVPPKNRHWQYDQDGIDRLWGEGRIVFSSGGKPRLKTYLENLSGVAVRDVWTDIPPINASAAERLGYPTQKPSALLSRIVGASSNPGDIVLDPFCGCGTTIDAVETLNREGKRKKKRIWIGIDITHIAVNLIKVRLNRFRPPPIYQVLGEPESVEAAAVQAKTDPFQFQNWALGLIGARSMGIPVKKGADRGIDGVRYFMDESRGGQAITKRMLVQVKSGHVKSGDIRDFVGTLTREGAEMGVFITLEAPTSAMRVEAASAGMYHSPWDKQDYPKVQVLTIEELLADPHRPNPRCLQVPGGTSAQHTLPEAPLHTGGTTRQGKLEL
jgi:DNA modification methylase